MSDYCEKHRPVPEPLDLSALVLRWQDAARAHTAACQSDDIAISDNGQGWSDRVSAAHSEAQAADAALLAWTPRSAAPAPDPFQSGVGEWTLACFGPEIARDLAERNHRFLEEALELVQSGGCTDVEAHQLVDYVYGRPEGEPSQEVGGVLVTLAALCCARSIDMQAAGATELARIWQKVELIRSKQAAKPKYSPLPAAPALVEPPAPPTDEEK